MKHGAWAEQIQRMRVIALALAGQVSAPGSAGRRAEASSGNWKKNGPACAGPLLTRANRSSQPLRQVLVSALVWHAHPRFAIVVSRQTNRDPFVDRRTARHQVE